VEGALHEDAWRYREWTVAMKRYLEDSRRHGDCRATQLCPGQVD
jgi:hypothetical protein